MLLGLIEAIGAGYLGDLTGGVFGSQYVEIFAFLVLILVLVFAALGSVRQALIVFAGIPLAVTGGVFALALRGMPFSITAAIGFAALRLLVSTTS